MRPYGPEEGTVIWLWSDGKCKCLCSDVYTSVSCARAQCCLPGCFLCIVFKLELKRLSKGRVGRVLFSALSRCASSYCVAWLVH